MMPGKKLRIFTIALFAIFAGGATCCNGTDNCVYGICCPNSVPPCVKVTFCGYAQTLPLRTFFGQICNNRETS